MIHQKLPSSPNPFPFSDFVWNLKKIWRQDEEYGWGDLLSQSVKEHLKEFS